MAASRRSAELGRIARAIPAVRGRRVMLDADLARLYGVETRTLNQTVTRHRRRLPPDFAYHLAREEFAGLQSQSVMSSWGGRRKPPLVFTEQGVAVPSTLPG